MIFSYWSVGLNFEVTEEYINTVVIENQKIFHDTICEIHNQISGFDGEIIISENHKPIELKKSAELISQFVPFEINQKELINKLYGTLKSTAVNENYYHYTQAVLSDISKYIYDITEDTESELSWDMPEDIGGILKAFNVRFEDNDMSLSEKIVEYITAVNRYKGERIFFLVNLRSYLTDKETELLFQNILLKKYKVICIENTEHTHLSSEKVVIIDNDMCVI